MAEAEKAKTGWLQKRREKREAKRAATGDATEVAVERAKTADSSDVARLRAVGRGYR